LAGQMGLLRTRQVAGFEGNTVAGGNKIGPGAEGGTDDMKGVTDVSTEGRITETAQPKRRSLITKGVECGMAAGADS
jgi:hypothetical protein